MATTECGWQPQNPVRYRQEVADKQQVVLRECQDRAWLDRVGADRLERVPELGCRPRACRLRGEATRVAGCLRPDCQACRVVLVRVELVMIRVVQARLVLLLVVRPHRVREAPDMELVDREVAPAVQC